MGLDKIKTENAVGMVLAHDMTQIIPGVSKKARFKKGHVVKEEDIPVLLSMGKEWLYVWKPEEGMIHEDEAAAILRDLCMSDHMEASAPSEGKIELRAKCDGLFKVDRPKLKAMNTTDQVMCACRHGDLPVKAGDVLAGMRVIPLVIDENILKGLQDKVEAPVFRLLPFEKKKTAVFTTGNEVYSGRIQDGFYPVLEKKLKEYEAEIYRHEILPDDPAMLTQKILDAKEEGAQLILCTGGMSVDPDDKTPLAIKNTGADIISYGAPVLPGAMMLVSYLDGVPVLGLPGCVMYSKRTIFDLLLPRVMANDPISKDDLCALGEGGLCLNCSVCTWPNCSFGKRGGF